MLDELWIVSFFSVISRRNEPDGTSRTQERETAGQKDEQEEERNMQNA